MTDQRELDRLLDAFFVEGTNELADRVIDAALDQIDHTQQRRVERVPWRFPTMTMPSRLAAAAVIGVLAVGGALILMRPSQSTIGGPSPTPEVSSRSTQPASPSTNPSASAVAPSVVPPRAATWTATGNMTQGRRFGCTTATLLPDGKVLMVGDQDQVSPSAERYDPSSGSWTATGSMAEVRIGCTATLLPDGRVLVAGGNDGPLASAELYNPRTGSWTPTGTMTKRRVGHTATLLQDGRVLVAGGYHGGDALASAELYDQGSGN
jgi:hypothetical protein